MQIDLSDAEIHRYARHILLPEVGGIGQMRLKNARVLIAGAGGLGSPLLLYLAAAGVGTIGVVDDDRVELSNLQRQIIHQTKTLGMAKVRSAAEAVRSLNPHVRLEPHDERLAPENVDMLISNYDLICDGLDNFPSRFLLADGCVRQKKTLVAAAVLRFEAHLSVYKPHHGADFPCFRCLYPSVPSPQEAASCVDAGIFGTITGVAGTLQATEVLKELLGIGQTLAGRLLIWDALAAQFRVIRVPRDPGCFLCGPCRTADAV